MSLDKNIKRAMRGLVGAKVVTYVDDDIDSNGIENFSIDDYAYYLDEMEDEILEFKAIEYSDISNHFRLIFTLK